MGQARARICGGFFFFLEALDTEDQTEALETETQAEGGHPAAVPKDDLGNISIQSRPISGDQDMVEPWGGPV